MIISLIVAMDRNRLIGAENRLPWYLPADLRWFKRNTVGKPVIMGRKTYESIGRPLPRRHNIVLTRNGHYQAPGCTVVHSVEAALAAGEEAAEVMVIGGAHIYEQLLPQAGRIYLTLIEAEFEGNVTFPELELTQWQAVFSERHEPDEKNQYPYQFLIFERY